MPKTFCHRGVMSRSLPRLTLTTSTSSLSPTYPILQSFSSTHPSLLSHDPYIFLHFYIASIHGGVAVPRISNLPQVLSPNGSSSTGILGLNIKIKYETDLWEIPIKVQSLKLCMNLEKMGVKSLSYNQSLIHSAYDSAESIAASDVEDE